MGGRPLALRHSAIMLSSGMAHVFEWDGAPRTSSWLQSGLCKKYTLFSKQRKRKCRSHEKSRLEESKGENLVEKKR